MATRRRYSSGAVTMSDEDQKRLDSYGAAWNSANAAGDQAGMQAAHDAAEALRAQYNYSGGEDGSEYIPLNTYHSSTVSPGRVESMGEFTYESAPTYTSKYQAQIDELLGEILNRPAFSYDPEADPRYQAFQKQYAREGQRATANTMGEYAAMTGGMPSTAATVAAQQAGQYYGAQMADRIPELYELAYAMYQDEGDNLRLNMDMLTALEQGDYNKYLNLLTQYNNDRAFAYGLYNDRWNQNYQLDRDDIADQRYDMEWNYGVNRDEIADERYDTELAYNQALDRAQIMAAAGDFSGYEALGYTPDQIATLQNAYDREMAGYSSGSSSGSSGSSEPRLTLSQALDAIEEGRVTDSVIDAYDYYMGDGAYEAQYGGGAESESSSRPSASMTKSPNSLEDYSKYDIDPISVINLGYGPISGETLADLEARGEIIAYIEDGMTKFRRVQ